MSPSRLWLRSRSFEARPQRMPVRQVELRALELVRQIGSPASSSNTRRASSVRTPSTKATLNWAANPQPPPRGLPALLLPEKSRSPENPHRLGWLNYWSDAAARAIGFSDPARDAELLPRARRTATGGWVVRHTETPLDLDNPAHLDALKRACERFPEIGGRSTLEARQERGGRAQGPAFWLTGNVTFPRASCCGGQGRTCRSNRQLPGRFVRPSVASSLLTRSGTTPPECPAPRESAPASARP
jgi:hypothetical protein